MYGSLKVCPALARADECCVHAAGITGGFAGGERGVQQFVEKGELELAAPGKGTFQH